MALLFKRLTILSIFLLYTIHSHSQLGISHEIGVIVGPVAFQSDYGVRKDFETNAGNTGIGIGIIHYINFAYRADCNCYSTDTYFNDHFKLRSEISWNKTKLNHFGEWADNPRPVYDKLRAHSGEANNWDIGMQLEYFPFSIRQFSATTQSWAPFVSLGAHFTSFNPKAETTFGDGNINNNNNIFDPWVSSPGDDPVKLEGGTTWSLVTSIGTRYKLSTLSDLMVDLRWQFFFNNEVDGLDHKLPSDKANDYLVWLNFGYIYYLD